MKFKIIGSGGCVSTPRPLCQCRTCKEARKKGVPYARCGCSLYLEDLNLLIDTPEDINAALNHADVKEIDTILFSHADPDHTMGIRVIEQLKMDWLARSVGLTCTQPLTVGALPEITKELRLQCSKYGSMLEYYEEMGLAKVEKMIHMNSNGIHIEFVPVDESGIVTVFVIADKEHKVIYAPCDVKPFPNHLLFYKADVLIIGNTIVGDQLKDGFVLDESNDLRKELFDMKEIVALKEKYQIGKVIITHLEEDWGKSYDDYLRLQRQYEGIEFAYDGMKINLPTS
jgi:phosphoribosyl 1,2-cyclic phosphate phosphodiesterase